MTGVIAPAVRTVLGDRQSAECVGREGVRDQPMGQQTIKQQARRTAREVAERRHSARMDKERRITDLADR